jgi:hypothetical protein
MNPAIRVAIIRIVTRVMREGGCGYRIKVTNVRANKAGWSARATVTRADGVSARYRAFVPSGTGGMVTVDLLPG